MPTLQEMVAQMAPEETVPAPTVPAPGIAPRGQALLAEVNLETPASAVQAIEQLARERYGEAFVDQYGDVLGFRPATFNDRLRNVFEIMASGNPAAARDIAFSGAQARADLEQSMLREAARRRRELADLYSFIPSALKSGMSAKNVRQLFSEQFLAITGEEAHPGVIDSLLEMEKTGSQPISKIIDNLRSGSLSLDDAVSMTTQIGPALKAFTDLEAQEIRKRETDIKAERLGDRAQRTLLQRKRVKEGIQRSRLQSRDRIFNSLLTTRRIRNPAEALAFANRAAGLPPPTPEEIDALGATQGPPLLTAPAGSEDVIRVE